MIQAKIAAILAGMRVNHRTIKIAMEDHEARRAINEQDHGMKKLMEAVASAANKQHEAEQQVYAEKVKSNLIEIQSKIYDRASAYANLIMIGGYAGSFATWAATRPQLPAKANIAIGLSLVISLAAFVLFEVYKMTYTAMKFMKNRSLLTNPLPPEEFLKNLQRVMQEEQKLSLCFMPIWIVTMVLSVGGGLIALGMLAYNYFALLLGWSGWPR